MPLEIVNPSLLVRFALVERAGPHIPMRYAALEIVTPVIIFGYLDEGRTQQVGERAAYTAEISTPNVVLDIEPDFVYVNNIKRLDYEVHGQYITLSTGLAVGDKLVALNSEFLGLYRTEDQINSSELWLPVASDLDLWIVSENSSENRAGELLFSVDDATFSKAINVNSLSMIYVKPAPRQDLFDVVTDLVDEQVVFMTLNSDAAGDLTITINSDNTLSMAITGHESDTCGIEYIGADGQPADFIGHSGVIGGISPSQANTFVAFVEVNQVRQYIGTVNLVQAGIIPVVTKMGCVNTVDLHINDQVSTLTPGTNPVMSA